MVKSVDNATKRTFSGKRNVANKAQSGKGKTHGTASHDNRRRAVDPNHTERRTLCTKY